MKWNKKKPNKVTWTFCRLDLCLEISVKFSINPTFCCAWSLFLLILFPLQMVFVCHFFCLPLLFLSLCSTPPHSSSTNPKFWYQKEQHIMDFILPLKFIWVSVWGRETKKKNLMFSDDGLCFSPSHTPSLTRLARDQEFEVCRNRATNLMISLKKFWVSERSGWKIFPLFLFTFEVPPSPYTPSY